MLKMFTRRAMSICQDTGDISTSEMVSLLHDCVQEASDNELIAFMAPTPAPSISADTALSRLRSIDIFKDDGVWATLDEGCNSCCHGKAWALNAEDKYEKLGYCLLYTSPSPRDA